MRKEDYAGSQKASDAAKKAWAKRRGAVVVGFYTDEEGEARPITKSTAELNRKKIIRKPKKFSGVKPKAKQKKTVNKRGFEIGDFVETTDGFKGYVRKITRDGIRLSRTRKHHRTHFFQFSKIKIRYPRLSQEIISE